MRSKNTKRFHHYRAFFVFSISFLSLLFAPFAVGQDKDDTSSLQPPEVFKGLPEKYADNLREFQGIPSLEVCSNNRLWASWYSGGSFKDWGEDYHNYVIVVTSGDAGKTWDFALTIDPDGEGPVRAYDSGIAMDPNGVLHIYWTQSTQYYDGRLGVWEMHSENPLDGVDAKWSKPRRLCDGLMINKPTYDSKGRILYPVSLWRNEPTDVHPEIQKGAFVYCSTDNGETVSLLGETKMPLNDSLYDEHWIVERKDGSFRMFLRSKTGIREATSEDGISWTDAQPSKVKHTSSRFCVRPLASGAWLLVKNGPIDQDVGRSRLTAYISDDEGETWTGGLLLDERADVSYPDGNQSDDGMITIVYDFNRFSDREILCARFTEDDVRKGEFASPNSQAKILINKATGEMKR